MLAVCDKDKKWIKIGVANRQPQLNKSNYSYSIDTIRYINYCLSRTIFCALRHQPTLG